MADVAEPLRDRAQARPVGILAWDESRQRRDRDQRADVRDRVRQIDPLEGDELEQHAGEGGPAHRAELRRHAVQCRRRHEVGLGDELGSHRALRADAEAERGRDHEL